MADRNANIAISVQSNASGALRQMAGDMATLSGEAQKAAGNFDRLDREFQQLQQSEIRVATATQQYGRALSLIQSEMNAAGAGTTRYNQLLLQQIGVQNRAAQATANAEAALRREQDTLRSALTPAANQAQTSITSLGGSFNQLTAAARLLGVGVGVKQLVDFGVEAGKDALALRETQNSLRAVAGSATVYNQVLATARQQQLLFGGSLRENIEGLSGLTITARQSGASLAQLVDFSQRLNVLSPEQGVGGARIALAEALSGNITSLSRRFEIPKSALKGLADESLSVEQRLKVLDDFLNGVGVTSASVAGKVDQNALAFRRLNAELETTRLRSGEGIANAFSGAATGLSRLLGVINQNPQAIAELKALLSGRRVVTEEDIGRETQNVAQDRARELLGGNRGATTVARRLGGGEEFGQVAAQLTRLIASGDDAAEMSTRLTRAFIDGGLTAQQYREQLNQLEQRQQSGVGVTSQAIAAANEAALAEQRHGEQIAGVADRLSVANRLLEQSARQSLIDAENKGQQAAQIELVQAQANQAADAFLRLHPNVSAAGAAAIAAAEGIDPLIAQLIQARLKADDATAALQRFQLGTAGAASFAPPSNALPGTRLRGANAETLSDLFGGGAQEKVKDTLQKQNELQQAQFQLDLQRARTAQERIAVLQRMQSLTTNEAEKLRLQAQIESQRDSGAKSHTNTLNTQLNLHERIRDSLEAQYKAQLDAAELAIRDRQERRKEDQEIRQAQRILASGRSSQLFKDAAADKLALIDIERQQRALAIQEKLATSGGTISAQGRVLQSVQRPGGAGIAPPQIPVPGQDVPTVPQIPVPGQAGGGVPFVDVKVFIDGQEIAARVITTMRSGLRSANAGGVPGRP